MRGRRGRHCPPLRRSAQGRCLASGPGRKGLGRSGDSPGSRQARLGLKWPHLLSQRRLPGSFSRHNDADALASWRHRAAGSSSRALSHQHFNRSWLREAGRSLQRGSDADAQGNGSRPLAISRAGAGQNKANILAPPLLALTVGLPVPLVQAARECFRKRLRQGFLSYFCAEL